MPQLLPRISCTPESNRSFRVHLLLFPGTMLSILFGLAFASYLIVELRTNEQLLNLSRKLKTVQIDMDTKQQIVEQLKLLNDDLQKSVTSPTYERNFAQLREGAFVETFYGSEIRRITGIVPPPVLRGLPFDTLGIGESRACTLLSSHLHPHKYLQFKGDHAGVLIRLVAPIAIHTVKYDHVITNFSDKSELKAAPKLMKFYGITNDTSPPTHLGNLKLKISRDSHHQQSVLQIKQDHNYYQHIRFDIVSNHGHPDHTIAYKLSVYGHPKPEWLD